MQINTHIATQFLKFREHVINNIFLLDSAHSISKALFFHQLANFLSNKYTLLAKTYQKEKPSIEIAFTNCFINSNEKSTILLRETLSQDYFLIWNVSLL